MEDQPWELEAAPCVVLGLAPALCALCTAQAAILAELGSAAGSTTCHNSSAPAHGAARGEGKGTKLLLVFPRQAILPLGSKLASVPGIAMHRADKPAPSKLPQDLQQPFADLTFPVKEELCAVPMEWEGLGCFTKSSPFTPDEQVC
ncbi:hypothetical protein EK904_001889 [Melospiza melodia maxima]|nr:hypothetical protein EK904_001889 [Melospiza melodia maxima]